MFDKPVCLLAVLLLPLLGGASTPAAERPSLKRLKTLAGDWALVDPAGQTTDLRATYQVVAGGAAVIETLFVGLPDETVTIYHLEGPHVTVTHLSGRGALARLAPGESRERDTFRFESEAQEARKGAVTGLQLALIDDEHLRIEWTLEPGGGGPDSRAFDLRREAPVAELAAEVARLRIGLESLQRELDRRLKRQVTVTSKGQRPRALLETRTFPADAGWAVSGVPFRLYLHEQTMRFASTFATQGDRGTTVGHYGFRAGSGCRVRFSVLGGHGYVTVVEETKAPPRRIQSIPEFSVALLGGEYGQPIERLVGGRWTDHPRTVEWDLSRFEGKALRLYVVDAETNHFGQISVSEVSILEDAPE